MRQTLLIITLCIALLNVVQSQVFYTWNAMTDESVLRLEATGKTSYLITSQRILRLEDEQWIEKWKSDETITAAIYMANNFWIGTKNGLYLLNEVSWSKTPLYDEAAQTIKEIAAIAPAADGQSVLISSYQSGFYEGKNGSVKKTASNYDINAVCDCGGWRWLGTNAGLIRTDGTETVTYTEEGVKGFEIPDNAVDALYCPGGRRLIVAMPEAIDFFALNSQADASHGEHFDYVGERGNTVTDVVQMADGSLLLLTLKGLLSLESSAIAGHEHHGGGFEEVFSTSSNAQVVPIQLGDAFWSKAAIDPKGYTWLAGKGKVAKIKTKKLMKLVESKRENG